MFAPDQLLTRRQLAQALGVSPATVDRWRRQGLEGIVLEPCYLGARPRYTLEGYRAFQAEVDRRRNWRPERRQRRQRAGRTSAEDREFLRRMGVLD